MSTLTTNPSGIRIIELPQCTMATSHGHTLEAFDTWWSALDRTRTDRFYPRDFMYYDSAASQLVWLYALPYGADSGPFQTIGFAGGLYAARISKDGDDADGERVMHEIKRWVSDTGYLADDEGPARPTLFHVITSDSAFAKMKHRQLDIYVPVK